MNIDIDDLKKQLEKDLQAPMEEDFEWRDKDKGTHGYSYTLEEICEGVEENAIPYTILWYILRYYILNDEQRSRVLSALEIDAALYDKKQVYNSYSVIGKCEEISYSEDVVSSRSVHGSSYVRDSYSVGASKYVSNSQHISSSKKITNSVHIFDSSNVDHSAYISTSSGVIGCQYIKLGNNISNSDFCLGCDNFENGLFCAFIKNEKGRYFIFNKEVSKENFDRVRNDLIDMFGKFFYVERNKDGTYVKERDINAFKEYCSSIIGYDKVIFDYLMREIFGLWKPIVTGKF